MNWSVVPGHIVTRWAAEVSPDDVWPSYPRPQMVRRRWISLNGLWRYGITPKNGNSPRFQGDILVPFPIESALSGVKQPLLPDQKLWYQRVFSIPADWSGERVLLHFGAVDWETTVWVNEHLVGTHRGGFLPFDFDISEYLRPGENELLVSVWDPTDTHWQARGKQTLHPKGIWYTAVSGIWQTVWLEPVNLSHIRRLKLTPDVDAQTLAVEALLSGEEGGEEIEVSIWDGARMVMKGSGQPGAIILLHLPESHLWSPDDPYVYHLRVEVHQRGRVLDEVMSYFGMRKFSMMRDRKGRLRMALNDRPLFQYGPLDQGYWPDGLYTPPNEAAMRADIDFVKSVGCNMLRKHVKVEPDQFYAYCDRKGIIVWQDMPNGAKPVGDLLSALTTWLGKWPRRDTRNYWKAGRQAAQSRIEFRQELQDMVDHLHNFVSIGMWVPFNEGWGQFDANAIANWLKLYDPTRPVDHASGWFDQGGGDFRSIHSYVKRLHPEYPDERRGVILSEFGGYGLKISGHAWNPAKQFGYGKRRSRDDLTEAYEELLERQLSAWVAAGLSGAVYTQLTDVETEINGWMTYDREVKKMHADRLRATNRRLLATSVAQE